MRYNNHTYFKNENTSNFFCPTQILKVKLDSGTNDANLIYKFSIDYLAGGNKNSASNIWIAIPHIYEIEKA